MADLVLGFRPVDQIRTGYGRGQCRHRERIGNAVPPPAAMAIASTMMETLLLARLEMNTSLHGTPVWVQPLATALSIQVAGEV